MLLVPLALGVAVLSPAKDAGATTYHTVTPFEETVGLPQGDAMVGAINVEVPDTFSGTVTSYLFPSVSTNPLITFIDLKTTGVGSQSVNLNTLDNGYLSLEFVDGDISEWIVDVVQIGPNAAAMQYILNKWLGTSYTSFTNPDPTTGGTAFANNANPWTKECSPVPLQGTAGLFAAGLIAIGGIGATRKWQWPNANRNNLG